MYWEWWLEFNNYAKYKDWFPLHLFLYAMHVNRDQKLFGYQHSSKYLWNNSRVSHSWQNFHFGVNYPFKRNLWKTFWSLLLVDFANLMYVMIKELTYRISHYSQPGSWQAPLIFKLSSISYATKEIATVFPGRHCCLEGWFAHSVRSGNGSA